MSDDYTCVLFTGELKATSYLIKLKALTAHMYAYEREALGPKNSGNPKGLNVTVVYVTKRRTNTTVLYYPVLNVLSEHEDSPLLGYRVVFILLRFCHRGVNFVKLLLTAFEVFHPQQPDGC